MAHQFEVIIEQDAEGYFVASVPALPGCHTQAKSLDVLMKRIREATSVLSADLSVQIIDGFRELIGDMEPLAPDVDYALDPLLRRDPPAPARIAVAPSETLDQKKERLKKLLLVKTQK